MSIATYTAPVNRFPVRSCARTPCAISESINLRRSMRQIGPRRASITLTPSLCGSISIVTGIENWKFRMLTCARMSGDLADLDAAKFDRRADRQPAHRFVEDELVGLRVPRRRLESRGPVVVEGEDACASAGGTTGRSGGVSNATPPIRIDSTDCVWTFSPLAESYMSTPLACQKRVFGLTY